jgi:hypothetical protein
MHHVFRGNVKHQSSKKFFLFPGEKVPNFSLSFSAKIATCSHPAEAGVLQAV